MFPLCSVFISHPALRLSHVCWNIAECWTNVIIGSDWCSILSSRQLAYSIFLLWPFESDCFHLIRWETPANRQPGREGECCSQMQGHRFQAHYAGNFCSVILSQTNQFNLWDERLKALMSNFNTTMNTKQERIFRASGCQRGNIFSFSFPPLYLRLQMVARGNKLLIISKFIMY